MKSAHDMVEYFNRHVLGITPRNIGLLGEDEFRLSMRQLREEIEEIEKAYEEGNLVGVVDGLIDLDYYHKGIVYKHGVTPALYLQGFETVHRYNMAKKLGVNPQRQGFGGSADAIKPEDWVGPEEELNTLLVQEKLREDQFA